jgi:hypothetical protein
MAPDFALAMKCKINRGFKIPIWDLKCENMS